jgi:hypothetical protein
MHGNQYCFDRMFDRMNNIFLFILSKIPRHGHTNRFAYHGPSPPAPALVGD